MRILALPAPLVLAACGVTGLDSAVSARDIAEFPVPREIVVAVEPYDSIEAALADKETIDWAHDGERAQAITLAYAAVELRDHLAARNIVTKVSTGRSKASSSIVIAVQPRFAGVLRQPAGELRDLGDQGYAIAPRGGSVYILANDRIGALNGVHRLLDYLGFAWYDPYETHLPSDLGPDTVVQWRPIVEVPRVDMRGFWIITEHPLSDEFAIWMSRNRFNIGGLPREPLQRMLGIVGWGGEHDLLQDEFSRPGLFEQHPDWFGYVNGARQPVAPSGTYINPALENPEAAKYFADRLVERLESGDLTAIDLLNIWPADSRFNTFDQSERAKALGNETDNLLQFYANVAAHLREANADGRLSRPVSVAGISYFQTMQPPTNYRVTAQLEVEDYVHIFYLIQRSWSRQIDDGLEYRDTNRAMLQDLDAWEAAARFDYGVVEYHNVSVLGAIGLSDIEYLAHNFEVLTRGRGRLFAYMHALDRNPGPRRLTNALYSRLAWRDLNVDKGVLADAAQVADDFFARRYGAYAAEWRSIHEAMAHSIENASEMFGVNSLSWVLLRELIWSPPPYSAPTVLASIPLYRVGGIVTLPAPFSRGSATRERFIGLDESIRMQEQARTRWEAVIQRVQDPIIRKRMEADVVWFVATAARYRLMAATCDYVVARQYGLDTSEPRSRIALEVEFLQRSPTLDDTISSVDQRGFLRLHRRLAGLQ